MCTTTYYLCCVYSEREFFFSFLRIWCEIHTVNLCTSQKEPTEAFQFAFNLICLRSKRNNWNLICAISFLRALVHTKLKAQRNFEMLLTFILRVLWSTLGRVQTSLIIGGWQSPCGFSLIQPVTHISNASIPLLKIGPAEKGKISNRAHVVIYLDGYPSRLWC